MANHYFDNVDICIKCDRCQEPSCCEQFEECDGTNWDFMKNIDKYVKEIRERRGL